MAAKTGLKVFYDSFSQPSRAVLLLLHANNVKYEPRMIKIAKGKQCLLACVVCRANTLCWHDESFSPAEHRTDEEFMKVNPNKKVPAIDDNGFHLFERWIYAGQI